MAVLVVAAGQPVRAERLVDFDRAVGAKILRQVEPRAADVIARFDVEGRRAGIRDLLLVPVAAGDIAPDGRRAELAGHVLGEGVIVRNEIGEADAAGRAAGAGHGLLIAPAAAWAEREGDVVSLVGAIGREIGVGIALDPGWAGEFGDRDFAGRHGLLVRHDVEIADDLVTGADGEPDRFRARVVVGEIDDLVGVGHRAVGVVRHGVAGDVLGDLVLPAVEILEAGDPRSRCLRQGGHRAIGEAVRSLERDSVVGQPVRMAIVEEIVSGITGRALGEMDLEPGRAVVAVALIDIAIVVRFVSRRGGRLRLAGVGGRHREEVAGHAVAVEIEGDRVFFDRHLVRCGGRGAIGRVDRIRRAVGDQSGAVGRGGIGDFVGARRESDQRRPPGDAVGAGHHVPRLRSVQIGNPVALAVDRRRAGALEGRVVGPAGVGAVGAFIRVDRDRTQIAVVAGEEAGRDRDALDVAIGEGSDLDRVRRNPAGGRRLLGNREGRVVVDIDREGDLAVRRGRFQRTVDGAVRVGHLEPNEWQRCGAIVLKTVDRDGRRAGGTCLPRKGRQHGHDGQQRDRGMHELSVAPRTLHGTPPLTRRMSHRFGRPGTLDLILCVRHRTANPPLGPRVKAAHANRPTGGRSLAPLLPISTRERALGFSVKADSPNCRGEGRGWRAENRFPACGEMPVYHATTAPPA